MKISQFISRFEEVKSSYGDLDVKFLLPGEEFSFEREVELTVSPPTEYRGRWSMVVQPMCEE